MSEQRYLVTGFGKGLREHCWHCGTWLYTNVRNNVRKTAHNMGVTGSEYGWTVKWAQDQADKMGTIRTRS